MTIGKINPLNQATSMQSINPTKAIGGHSSGAVAGSTNNNPFGSSSSSSNTVGLNNPHMQKGDAVNLPAQAGKKAGIGRMLGIG